MWKIITRMTTTWIMHSIMHHDLCVEATVSRRLLSAGVLDQIGKKIRLDCVTRS